MLLPGYTASAQLETNSTQFKTNYALPSPEAAAVTQVADIPVDLSTGRANISIPLYEINTGTIRIPITLSYDASGIKVEQQSTAVGLGWSLNAGGAITRKIRDKDDFLNGHAYEDLGGLDWINQGPPAPVTYMRDYTVVKSVTEGNGDAIPDLYSYSANGLSGNFIRVDNTTRLMPKANLDIKGGLAAWTLIDGNGYTYSFGGTDKDGTAATENNDLKTVLITNGTNSEINYRTTWWLTKIVNDHKADEVNFLYDESYVEYPAGKSFSRSFLITDYQDKNFSQARFSSKTSTLQRSYAKTLKRIEFNNGVVEFLISKTNREDILSTNNQPRIEQMIVTDKQGNEIRKIRFYYDYFMTQAPAPIPTLDKYRLKLTRISIQNGSLPAEEYTFSYNTAIPLPLKSSLGQDHWGYYNGKNDNTTLIPRIAYFPDADPAIRYPFLTCNGPNTSTEGADREVDTNFVQAGILKQITYPTGGTVSFDYESNTVPVVVDEYKQDIIKGIVNIQRTSSTSAQTSDGSTITMAANDPAVEVYEFTVPSNAKTVNGVKAMMAASFSGSGGQGVTHSVSHTKLLYKASGSSQWQTLKLFTYGTNSGGCDDQMVLYPGAYSLVASTMSAGYSAGGSISLVTAEVVYPVDMNKRVGGLRVKKVTYAEPYNGTAKTTTYSYEQPGTTKSSGYLPAPIDAYSYHKQNFIYRDDPATAPECWGFPYHDPNYQLIAFCCHHEFQYKTLVSQPRYELESGSPIYYQYVTAHHGTNNERGTESNEYNRELSTVRFWRNTQLLAHKQYNQAGNKVGEESYEYEVVPASVEKFQGWSIEAEGSHPCAAPADSTAPPSAPVNSNYRLGYASTSVLSTSEWERLKKKTSRQYTDQTVALTQTEQYEYNSLNLEVTKTTTDRSDGRKTVQYFKYPVDYTIPPQTTPSAELLAIDVLKRQHVTSQVVEKYTALSDNGTERVTDGTYMGFSPVPASLVTEMTPDGPISHYTAAQADNLYRTELQAPLTGFQPAAVTANGSSSGMVRDNTYKLQTSILQYDSRLNPTELKEAHGNKSSLLWMYDKALLTCEVKNAGQNEIAYSSFEDPAHTGNWTYNTGAVSNADKLTGTKCFNMAMGNITKSGIAYNNYIVSYWKKGGNITVNGLAPTITNTAINGWVYCQHLVSNSTAVSVAGTGLIDELRLYPEQAMMKTYCHAPLVGIISSCDEKNAVRSYEYDASGRLTLIRDQAGNIVKKMEYTVNQPE